MLALILALKCLYSIVLLVNEQKLTLVIVDIQISLQMIENA